MKPQRFELGQEVTPTKKETWIRASTGENHPGPVFGNVYTVAMYVRIFENRWVIHLSEIIEFDFFEDAFDPVGNLDEVKEVLRVQEKQFEPEVSSMLSLFRGLFENL